MVGNHDFQGNYQYLSTNHWLNAIKEFDNVTVIDTVNIVEIDKIKIVMVPYVPDGKFKTALDTRKGEWEDSTCIFAHQLFDGAKMGSIVAEDVEKWEIDNPMIFCGHIHDRQWVQDNIYIVGSAMQEAFGETEDKTLLLLTLDGKTLDKESLDDTRFRTIDLDLPKKRIIYMEMEDLDKFDMDSLKENVEYKLTLDGDQEEFEAFKKTVRYKEMIKKVKIVFKHKRVFIAEKKDYIKSTPTTHKPFNKILEELVSQETNPYLTDLFNTIVLKRTDVKDDILLI